MLPALGASVPVLRPRGAALGLARLLRRHNASEAAQDAASAALERCTRAPDADARAVASACRELLQAHTAFGAEGRHEWWASRALAEEAEQLQVLSRALPRGGRVGPQMLDALRPVEPEASEAAVRRLVAVLGADEGLRGALQLRAGLRAALAAGSHGSEAFALERLDGRLRDLLGLWLSPAWLRVDPVGAAAAPEVAAAAAAVAAAASPHAAAAPHAMQRCFALRHGLMSPDGPPLLVAHASLLDEMPSTLRAASAPSDSASPRAACLWALGPPPGEVAQALRGLGLGQVLRRGASDLLRAELGGPEAVVGALAPLRGFSDFLVGGRGNWGNERLGLSQPQAEALQRAAEGHRGYRGPEEVRFVDVDGDDVRFRLRAAEGGDGAALEVEIAGGPPRRVLKLAPVEEGRALRLLLEPGPEAFQIQATDEVAGRGDLESVRRMADAAGLLLGDMQEPVLRLAYDFITRRGAGGKHSAEPITNFHLRGGGALNALHWDADDSVGGLADHLGIMVSFIYKGHEVETEAALAYAQDGLNAATFTASS